MRLGIVGCGLIGQKRAAAAAGHQIVVVADLDPERARFLAARTGASVASNWQEVASANIDAVIVSATHDVLAAIAAGCVEAGKHVLVEKPAGRTTAEVAAVAAAARKHSRVVKVGFNHRFHPGILKAKEIADSGAVGPLLTIRGRYGHGGRVGYEKEWRCDKERSGGGELIDQGAHLIDLSRWFLGDLELAFAATPTLFWKIAVEDNCFVALRTADSRIAWLHASWSEWKNIFSFEIYGRDGKLTVEGLGGSYGTERLTWHRMLPQMGPPETTSWEYPFADRSWELEFDNFVDAIATGRRAIGDIYDAVAMHEIIEKAYEGSTR